MNASILAFYTYVILHTCKVQRNLPNLAQFQDLVVSILWRKTFLYSHTILNSLLFLL